jgi:hypothetical protein
MRMHNKSACTISSKCWRAFGKGVPVRVRMGDLLFSDFLDSRSSLEWHMECEMAVGHHDT